MDIKLGDVWFAKFRQDESIQGGIRPCIIKSNDKNNIYSPNVSVIPLTTKNKKYIPTHITIYPTIENGLIEKSIALCENIIPIPKSRLIKKIGFVNEIVIQNLDIGCSIQLDIKSIINLDLINSYIDDIQAATDDMNSSIDKAEYFTSYGIMKIQLKNLRMYCQQFGINYTKYLKNIKIKEKNMLGVI